MIIMAEEQDKINISPAFWPTVVCLGTHWAPNLVAAENVQICTRLFADTVLCLECTLTSH